MSKITYLASVSDGKISFPSGVLDSTMLSTEVNNTSTNDTIPTSKAVYDSIVKFSSQNITEQDGVVTIKSDKYLVLPQVNQITNSSNYLQQGWYYQHFDISGLGTNEEIISGTKNTVIFWLSDSTEQIVEDIQNPTYIAGFNSGFQIGWWMSGVNDGRFPADEKCHFEITEIDANKITVKLYAKDTSNLWWVDGWLRNGKVDLTGSLSKDDYTVYCNGATATTPQEKLIETQCGGMTISNISLFVGSANFFGSNNNITCGNSNYTTIGNTLTVGAGLINSTYSGTVLGSYNEPNGGLLQVGGGTGEGNRKTLFSVHAGGDGKIQLNAPTEVYKDVNIKNSNNENTVAILAESGDIYVNSNLGSNALKDNASDKVIVARKSDGGLYKSNVTTQELSNVAGTTSPIQIQINDLTTSTLELSNALITKQNGGQLYLNGGYATTNCKPTFGAAQSLLFTYEVSETELDSAAWCIIGNLHIWSSQKGFGFAKNTSNKIQCGFNWNGNTTGRAFIEANTTAFADGKPHAWALICGKDDTSGFFKLYCDGVLIGSKTSLALFNDFIPTYGFYFGKSQVSSAQDSSAKGRLSRVAFFNFDVSAPDALYSLADYQTGKSIPPTLNLMAQDVLTLKESDVPVLTQSTYNLGDLALSTVWEDGYLTWKAGNTATITAEQAGKALNMSLIYTLPTAIPQWAQVDVSFDDWAFNTELFNQSGISANPVNQRYYGWFTLGTAKNSAIANTENIGHGKTLESKNFKFTSTVKADKLYILPYSFTLKSIAEQEIAAGTVFAKVKGLKVKVNGAALNLENYTIARNTTTRLVKDLSAGGYDATITGEIRGDMDRRVEVFVDELKTQIAQSTTTTD